jgi:hypothetical protein
MEWRSAGAVLSSPDVAEKFRKSLAVSRLVGAVMGALWPVLGVHPSNFPVLIEGEKNVEWTALRQDHFPSGVLVYFPSGASTGEVVAVHDFNDEKVSVRSRQAAQQDRPPGSLRAARSSIDRYSALRATRQEK